jgi:putative SOS response-associated peptidase YedK
MCAQYLLKSKVKELEKALGIKIDLPLEWSERILPYAKEPAVTKDGVHLMNFSLIPVWSKEPKMKFATHNARLETIDEKATWKRPFLKNHCFIPMNSFVEPIYEGKLAGNMIAFDADQLMYAAAIYDTWTNKKTGEVIDSFSIITSEPSAFVKKIGHDRQPIFLPLKKAIEWETLEGPPEKLKTFLKESAETPALETSVDRPLKSGWQKRHEAKK